MTTRQPGRSESTRGPVPMAGTGDGPRPDPTTYAPSRSDERSPTRSDDERRATANRTPDRTPT